MKRSWEGLWLAMEGAMTSGSECFMEEEGFVDKKLECVEEGSTLIYTNRGDIVDVEMTDRLRFQKLILFGMLKKSKAAATP